MSEPTITCPNCRTEIKLTESLAAPLLESTRHQYEQKLAAKEREVCAREATLRQQQAALDEQVAEKLNSERSKIEAEEAKKARTLLGGDLEAKAKEVAELQEVLKLRDEKLAEAQKAQVDLIRKQRELDDAKREMDLTVEKRVQESLTAARDKAKKEAAEEMALQLAQRDQTITTLKNEAEQLRRKAEQGSQQAQGETLELVLEEALRQYFPMDSIVPVPKGVHGGDVMQIVREVTGAECGIILWEAKRTKSWNDGWLAKLRDDKRAAKAHVAILVSVELPKDVSTFECIDGVWVTSRACACALASALRAGITEAATARRSTDGKHTKMEILYNYLSGQEFRHRVEGIAEAFIALKEDLEVEKRAAQRSWAKREKQLERAIMNTSGMYGDLQGIIGATLPSIESLDPPLLEKPSE
jgi:hypothetical protein